MVRKNHATHGLIAAIGVYKSQKRGEAELQKSLTRLRATDPGHRFVKARHEEDPDCRVHILYAVMRVAGA